MRDTILEKIRVVLEAGVDNECKVVYVLAESRKLLDKYPPDPLPSLLKMYCHWALHIDLTRWTHTQRLLTQVDAFTERVLSRKTNVVEDHRLFREFALFETFRDQFKLFLRSYDLPTAVCDDGARWHEFLEHYAAIIEDGSLSCSAASGDLKFVKEVVITKGRPAPDGDIPFFLAWLIRLSNGKELAVEVNPFSTPAGKGIAFGITIR